MSSSPMAALMGSAAASSIQRNWPFGLISRKTWRPSGVRIRSIAP
jgi:hypothetical protein